MTAITKFMFIVGFSIGFLGQLPTPPQQDNDIIIVTVVCDERCIPAHLVE